MVLGRLSPPGRGLALALAAALFGGSGCASVYLGTEHPEGCARLGPVSGDATARAALRAAEQARQNLRAVAGRGGANYVEVMFENEQPALFGSRTEAHAGGIAWRCPALPAGAD